MFGQQQGGGEDEILKGMDVKMDLDVTLEQLYNGDIVEIMRKVGGKNTGTESKCLNEMKTAGGVGRFHATAASFHSAPM